MPCYLAVSQSIGLPEANQLLKNKKHYEILLGINIVGRFDIRECWATLKNVYLYLKLLSMTIQRIDNQIVISLPGSIDLEGVQRLINYLLYKEATKDSKAKQEDVDILAREANKQWWAENKHRFLPE